MPDNGELNVSAMTRITWFLFPALAYASVYGSRLPVQAGEPEKIVGPAAVIDGDSIVIEGRKLDLFGIIVPNLDQTCEWPEKTIQCGAVSKTALMDLVAGSVVVCRTLEPRDDATVARCQVDDFDLSANMVHTGWAVVDRRVTDDNLAREAKAKAAKRGLWKGEFSLPVKGAP